MRWHSRLYTQTLKSPRWRRLRRRIYRWRARGRCEERTCRSRLPLSALDLHHDTYKRLGWERWRDVRLLCRPCHRAFHAGQRGRL